MALHLLKKNARMIVHGYGFDHVSTDSGSGSEEPIEIPMTDTDLTPWDIVAPLDITYDPTGLTDDQKADISSMWDDCMSSHGVPNVVYLDGLTYIRMSALAIAAKCLAEKGAFDKYKVADDGVYKVPYIETSTFVENGVSVFQISGGNPSYTDTTTWTDTRTYDSAIRMCQQLFRESEDGYGGKYEYYGYLMASEKMFTYSIHYVDKTVSTWSDHDDNTETTNTFSASSIIYKGKTYYSIYLSINGGGSVSPGYAIGSETYKDSDGSETYTSGIINMNPRVPKYTAVGEENIADDDSMKALAYSLLFGNVTEVGGIEGVIVPDAVSEIDWSADTNTIISELIALYPNIVRAEKEINGEMWIGLQLAVEG